MQQPVFASGGHHAVGFVCALGHEVVYERADIAVGAPEYHGLLAAQLQRRVHARDKALSGSLLVARRAVELPRAVQPAHLFCLQRGIQLRGVDAVVFYGVGAAGHLGLLKSRDGVQKLKLHLLGKRGGQALDIQLFRVEPHGLDEKLVPGLVTEGHYLCLDARAVARPDTLDDARIYGAAVEVIENDLVGAFVCIGQPAHGLVLRRRDGVEGKALGLCVPGLQLHFGIVDAAGVYSRRGAGLEPAHGKPQLPQTGGEARRGGKTVGPGGAYDLADDRPAVKICAAGDNDGSALVHRARVGGYGAHRAVGDAYLHDLGLLRAQILLPLEGLLHDLLIAPAVGLSTQGVHGRPFSAVEHTVLDAGLVGRPAHLAAERVKLPHEMPLARSADGGVAGHIAHAVKVYGKADGVKPHTGCRQSRLDARVSRADDRNIAFSC